MTAVSGARQGLKTVLFEPRNHVGGLVSGGLSGTDVGRREVIGGLALEFYYLAGRHYGLERHLREIAWMPEPRVAEAIFRRMQQDAGVTLLERHRLREKTGVRKSGARIEEIVMENGARFQGGIFADGSYEGDLMAQSGVSCTFGRESTQQHGESLAGEARRDAGRERRRDVVIEAAPGEEVRARAAHQACQRLTHPL